MANPEAPRDPGTKTEAIPGRAPQELGDKLKARMQQELEEHLDARMAKRPAETPAPEATASHPWLVIESGPDKGRSFPLAANEITIGRAPDNTIFLPDPTVSKRHVKIHRAGPGYEIEDLGSRNGTLLNGKTVSREMLSEGDRLTIGTTTLRYRAAT